ncbi:type II secretion system protein [Patescibacteria group bacterium]
MKNQVLSIKYKGFTLIELVVVVAVIAMLSSFVIAFLSDSKTNARDSRREEDILELQNMLNLYATTYQLYPACAQTVINGNTDCLSSVLVSGEFAVQSPVDPLGGSTGACNNSGDHVYCYTSDGFGYLLEYALETDNITGKSSGWQSVLVEH